MDDEIGGCLGGVIVIGVVLYVGATLLDNLFSFIGNVFWRFFNWIGYMFTVNLFTTLGGIFIIILIIILIRGNTRGSIFEKVSNLFDGSRNKYVTCPYCNKSVLFYYKWECDYCYNTQDKERGLDKPCLHCKRKLDSFHCDDCKKEILL